LPLPLVAVLAEVDTDDESVDNVTDEMDVEDPLNVSDKRREPYDEMCDRATEWLLGVESPSPLPDTVVCSERLVDFLGSPRIDDAARDDPPRRPVFQSAVDSSRVATLCSAVCSAVRLGDAVITLPNATVRLGDVARFDWSMGGVGKSFPVDFEHHFRLPKAPVPDAFTNFAASTPDPVPSISLPSMVKV
jgi:hypothetical protein